jgi:ubiquitin-conjugating enzyme E2 D/E
MVRALLLSFVHVVCIAPDMLCDRHATLVGPPDSPYAGGVFHFRMRFAGDYPRSPPSCDVLTPLPHPHVQVR